MENVTKMEQTERLLKGTKGYLIKVIQKLTGRVETLEDETLHASVEDGVLKLRKKVESNGTDL